MIRPALFLIIVFLVIGTPGANAQLDANNNGMSDIWERFFNQGDLFDSASSDHSSTADPDGDNWTNLNESAAGTNPFDGTPPQGKVAVFASHLTDQFEEPSQEFPQGRNVDMVILTWDTVPGKIHTLEFSTDLSPGNWIPCGDSIYGDGDPAGVPITLTDSGGESPPRLFWRVSLEDVDTDADGLSDSEESLLGTDPNLTDTDEDEMDDHWEVSHRLNPLDPSDDETDSDGDGLTNLEEHLLGTDPCLLDTDGDGIDDDSDSAPLIPDYSEMSTPNLRVLTPLR